MYSFAHAIVSKVILSLLSIECWLRGKPFACNCLHFITETIQLG